MREERGQGESQRERVNRELIELLQELRVALPGVQVLFAFLLTVPFSQGFATTTSFQRDLFFATLAATAVSTALLIAPSSWHRIRFRQKDKERMLIVSNNLSIGRRSCWAGSGQLSRSPGTRIDLARSAIAEGGRQQGSAASRSGRLDRLGLVEVPTHARDPAVSHPRYMEDGHGAEVDSTLEPRVRARIAIRISSSNTSMRSISIPSSPITSATSSLRKRATVSDPL